jgi:hypothetical protein
MSDILERIIATKRTEVAHGLKRYANERIA